METLRIEFGRENLDGLGREMVGADLAAMTDLDLFEKLHQTAPSRRSIRIGEVISHSASPLALRAVHLNLTMPSTGRLLDVRASTTSTASVRSSPGLNGESQRTSSTPGEPSEAARVMKPSAIIRIISEQRCQPEPDRPRSMLLAAASSSRCIGCGSNSAAKARISSRVTWRGPNVPNRPGGKSSKVRVIFGLLVGMTDCGRTLRQSQPAGPHGSCYIRRVGPDRPPGQIDAAGGANCPGERDVFIQRSVSMGPLHPADDHQDLLLA